MASDNKSHEIKISTEQRGLHRVSRAFWPNQIRKGVATDKAAQRRRDWIMQGRWWVILSDVCSLRPVRLLVTFLVVCSSLLVAVLGLAFWYVLVLPLALFATMMIVPMFLASRVPDMPAPPLSAFAQEFRSSAGFLSQYAHELKSSAGISVETVPEMQAAERGNLGSDSPATPMPPGLETPLIRVLKTYDLSQSQVKHFLVDPLDALDALDALDPPDSETEEQPAVRYHKTSENQA